MFSKWSYFSITKTYILYCSCSKIPQPLAIPSPSHVWGLPSESKLFVGRHYFSGNSSAKTWWSHCYSGDHLSPLEDLPVLPSYNFLWEDSRLLAWWVVSHWMRRCCLMHPSTSVPEKFSFCLALGHIVFWRRILNKKVHAKMGMCSNISMLTVRVDLKVFWNKSVFKKTTTTTLGMLITHRCCRMMFPFDK